MEQKYKEIYLDNASTTKVDERVAERVCEVMVDFFGNPSSRHLKGAEANHIISEARAAVANLIFCKAENVIFTSGGTESNNLAILGSLNVKNNKSKNIITSTVEHSSVMENMKKLESFGFKVNYIPPKSNLNNDINPEDIWCCVDENTVLVSIMNINNETGNIYDIKQIVKGIRHINKDVIIHCDGVQAFGKTKIDVTDLDVDLYSFSGHKIHAPKGVGGLYVKNKKRIVPLIIGGSQEFGRRCGTENVAGIAGLGKACELIDVDKDYNYVKNLYNLLVDEIKNINSIHINSIGNILPYVFNFSLENHKSEVVLNQLQLKNIFVSNGSACSKGAKSVVLKNMGLLDKYIESSIRVSFSKYNTKQDVLNFVAEIKNVLDS